MHRFVRTRLSAMMFFYYASLGAWSVTTATYLLAPPESGGLGFSKLQVGWIYSTFALGGMLANPLVGLLADRLFAAQRVFAVAAVLNGVILLAAGVWCQTSFSDQLAAYQTAATEIGNTQPENRESLEPQKTQELIADHPLVRTTTTHTFGVLFAIMLLQALALQVGLTLVTVLSLRNLPRPSLEFSRTRMWGTIGWVVIGLLMGVVVKVRSPEPFFLGGVVAMLVGVYGLTLPHTPPKGTGKTLREAFGLPALKLFHDRSFVVFIAVAYLASVMNQFYGVYGHKLLTDWGIPQAERWMTIGQAVEVVVMFMIPVLKPQKTMKWLMLFGLIGWFLRGVVLASGSPADRWWAIGLAVPMHGWSFAFYFIVAATYIDREAPPHLRASAQAIVNFVASGLGPWTGNMIAAEVVGQNSLGNSVDWARVWILPTICCGLLCVLFAWLFQPPPDKQPTT